VLIAAKYSPVLRRSGAYHTYEADAYWFHGGSSREREREREREMSGEVTTDANGSFDGI